VNKHYQAELKPAAGDVPGRQADRRAFIGALRCSGRDLWSGRGLWCVLVPLVGAAALFGAALWQILGPVGPYTDAARYQCYAIAFWRGAAALSGLTAMQHCQFLAGVATKAPFHTLPLEYPLLVVVPFTLPLIAPGTLYQVAFALWMGLLAVGIYGVLQRWGPRGSALLFMIYLVVGCWGTAEGRFDLLPAALTLGSLMTATYGRWRWAYVLLALATMLKFYPIVLLPALFIAEQRELLLGWRDVRRLVGAAVFAGICVGLTLVSFALSVPGTLSPFAYFGVRPIQVESLAATLVWFIHLGGVPSSYDFTFGSLNVLNPWAGVVSGVLTLVLVAGFAVILFAQVRGRMCIGEAYLVILLLVIVTGKVFSPQYLIWLAPIVAYVTAKDWRWFLLWGTVSLLTTLIYPYIYELAPILQVPTVPEFFPVAAARNLLFLLITVSYGLDIAGLRHRLGAPAHHWDIGI